MQLSVLPIHSLATIKSPDISIHNLKNKGKEEEEEEEVRSVVSNQHKLQSNSFMHFL